MRIRGSFALAAALALGIPGGAVASASGHHWGGTTISPVPPTASAASGSRISDGPRVGQLSNETTFTRYATATARSIVRAHPTYQSRSKHVRLHFQTEDGFREVYLLLRSAVDSSGRQWVELRLPRRPNGSTGWVPRSVLGRFHIVDTLLVVNRHTLRMHFYENGKEIWHAPVGVGKPSTPTPAGHFWIRELFKINDPSSGYYPYAFGTADYSVLTDWPGGGVVGIHGPYYEPSQIPGRPSHGCMRLRVHDDAWLGHHMPIGTPVRVI